MGFFFLFSGGVSVEIQPEFVCVTRYLCGDILAYTDDDGGSSSAERFCFVLVEAHTFLQFFG